MHLFVSFSLHLLHQNDAEKNLLNSHKVHDTDPMSGLVLGKIELAAFLRQRKSS